MYVVEWRVLLVTLALAKGTGGWLVWGFVYLKGKDEPIYLRDHLIKLAGQSMLTPYLDIYLLTNIINMVVVISCDSQKPLTWLSFSSQGEEMRTLESRYRDLHNKCHYITLKLSCALLHFPTLAYKTTIYCIYAVPLAVDIFAIKKLSQAGLAGHLCDNDPLHTRPSLYHMYLFSSPFMGTSLLQFTFCHRNIHF